MLLCLIFKSEVEGRRSGGREEEKHANYPPLFFSQRLFCNLVRMIARVYDKNKPEEDTSASCNAGMKGLHQPCLLLGGPWSRRNPDAAMTHGSGEWQEEERLLLVVRSKLW